MINCFRTIIRCATVLSLLLDTCRHAEAASTFYRQQDPKSFSSAYNANAILRRPDITDLGPAPAGFPAQLELVLPIRDPATRDLMLASIHDPVSPFFRHFISNRQFVKSFAPTASQYETALARVSQIGLHVVRRDPDRERIFVTAPLGLVDRLFGTESHLVRQSGSLRHLEMREAVIPRELSGIIANVAGTSNVVTAHTT